MRKINPNNFQVATRGTSREINRQIALNLVRTHQPISRADLARIMGLRRGAVSLIVNDLLAEGLVFEGATGESHRGRKPTFLYIDSRERCVVAVDIRVTRTFLMVTDLLGRQLVGVISFPTEREPKRLVAELGKRIKKVLAEHKEAGACKGVRRAYFRAAEAFVDTSVYDRRGLAPGMTIDGPALIEEPESTLLLPPQAVAQVEANGNIVVTLASGRGGD